MTTLYRKLVAFRAVSQRFNRFPSTAAGIVEEINRVHSQAPLCRYACKDQVCSECVHRKVLALWRMEALGVRLGRNHWRDGSWCFDFQEDAWPIVGVGLGAGVVARYGFNQTNQCIELMPTEMQPWAWEGVGHMLALQFHPVVAWLLGMPRPRAIMPGFAEQFPDDVRKRIYFGYSRMRYLCGAEGPGAKGARFAEAMLNHQDWGKPPCPHTFSLATDHWRRRCQQYRHGELPGEAAARAFLDKVWP